MVEKRKMPKWAKILLLGIGIFLFLFILILFDHKYNLFGGVTQAYDYYSYYEYSCFDKQYLNDFKSNPSYFLFNITSYAVSVYRIEFIADKEIFSKRNVTGEEYFSVRENGTFKEVNYYEMKSFLDSYCEDCLICYGFFSYDPSLNENYSTLWDYKTSEYFCDKEENKDWVCYDEPQLPMVN